MLVKGATELYPVYFGGFGAVTDTFMALPYSSDRFYRDDSLYTSQTNLDLELSWCPLRIIFLEYNEAMSKTCKLIGYEDVFQTGRNLATLC